MSVPDLHICPASLPVVSLDCAAAWAGMSPQERLYAAHYSRASWAASLIVASQVSSESPMLLELLHLVFTSPACTTGKLKEAVGEEDWESFVTFAVFAITNLGNYQAAGDKKVIPRLSKDAFGAVVSATQNSLAQLLWGRIGAKVYDASPPLRSFSLGCSGYYAGPVTEDDVQDTTKFLASIGVEEWNTRLERSGDKLVVHIASVDCGVEEHTFGGRRFEVRKGDYSEHLRRVVRHLSAAEEHALNDRQREMLGHLTRHFVTGDIADHKKASQVWVQDVGPAVETYIGFVETDRDPSCVRAEFEGFVAAVDRQMTRRFDALVGMAEELLSRLPWAGKGFEKDHFVRPDFTSLKVLNFAAGMLPLGICLPNYDDIRTDGYKNVDLDNVSSAAAPGRYAQYLSKQDTALFEAMFARADQVLTGLHELIGHGSGKLLRNEAGQRNFPAGLLNPCTGAAVAKWYDEGQSYGSVFGRLASAMEECRAECVSLYLGTAHDVQRIFEFEGAAIEDSIYVGWLGMCWRGLLALVAYDAEAKTWGSPHARARFAILRAMCECGAARVVDLEGEDGKPDMLLEMKREAIAEKGRDVIGKLLLDIHVSRCTADPELAEGFVKASAVEGVWLQRRDVAEARRKPRESFCQPLLTVQDGAAVIRTYSADYAGVIQSFTDRWAEVVV
eukprot:TRINITY_DN3609_c0_g1_i1.p1 TRINITY_DN3609_c0_g1~~TRINITY_DN3609_c0_g1_i1.p1  ORF type:complete len:701 (+),score=267.74 TRINITY_DN3609_c0_g1_i1:87-2105(+)